MSSRGAGPLDAKEIDAMNPTPCPECGVDTALVLACPACGKHLVGLPGGGLECVGYEHGDCDYRIVPEFVKALS